MKRPFRVGILTGIVISFAVYCGAVILFPGDRGNRNAEGESVRRGKATGNSSETAQKLKILESELQETRKEHAALKAKHEETKTLLEASKKIPKEGSSADGSEKGKEGSGAKDSLNSYMKKMMRRLKIKVGEPLPKEFIEELGLNEAQARTLNVLLQQEAEQMNQVLRRNAMQNTSDPVGKDGSIKLVIQALGDELDGIQSKLASLFTDEEVMSGKKTIYLDEVFGSDSAFVGMMEQFLAIRSQTLTTATAGFEDELRRKVYDLLERTINFGTAGFSFPENFVVRKP